MQTHVKGYLTVTCIDTEFLCLRFQQYFVSELRYHLQVPLLAFSEMFLCSCQVNSALVYK